jgi:hypothetical protein
MAGHFDNAADAAAQAATGTGSSSHRRTRRTLTLWIRWPGRRLGMTAFFSVVLFTIGDCRRLSS